MAIYQAWRSQEDDGSRLHDNTLIIQYTHRLGKIRAHFA